MLRRDVNLLNKMTDGSLKIGELHVSRLNFRHFRAPFLPLSIYNYIRKQWINAAIKELRHLSKFVVLTHEDAISWSELDNVVVIPNPTPFFPDSVSDCSQKKIVAVGRYVELKGFDKLITAWRKVVDKNPDWILKIYGDGEMRESLQQQIKTLNLTKNCFLEHAVSDIVAKYLESSIFVLTSRTEGFGMVIVEAMACGLPVVSFACPCGPRDIISNGIDGFLVEVGDIDGLVEKLDFLIENQKYRKEFGHMARFNASKYKIESIGELWVELFESLLYERRVNV